MFFKRKTDGVRVVVRGSFHALVLQAVHFNAWGSHMYSFATWDGMYCMFPKLTLRDRKSVLLHSGERFFDKSQVDVYVKREFEFVDSQSVVSSVEFHGQRRAGDEHTLRVPFSLSAREKVDFGSYVRFDGGCMEFRRDL